MYPDPRFKELTWRHELWGFVRLFRSLRVHDRHRNKWLTMVAARGYVEIKAGQKVPVAAQMRKLLADYLDFAAGQLALATDALRSEEQALRDCAEIGAAVGRTQTQSQDHHQSSKALVAQVSALAREHCRGLSVACDVNPQRRAVWLDAGPLHVSARNLDGAIPALVNPLVIWEIKEYWGKKKGGSKMSDAVYECQLVGSELRNYEAERPCPIHHVVFLDGAEQWARRKSDLIRFIDLASQGLIDRLIIGNQVKTEWPELLKQIPMDGLPRIDPQLNVSLQLF
jgi:hypothetical protein